MKISLDWLGDFVTFTEKDPLEIAKRITESVAEIDEVEMQGKLLEHCCVGKVLSVSKHPNADKLSLCEVKTDKGKKKVVCGGTNLREGMRVAFAHIGATVKWHGQDMMTLEKTKIRGEESEGMICAAEELELSTQFPDAKGHSIIDIGDGDDAVGKSLKEFLGLSDTILHVDNHAITQRPDLFSHIGFARECVALGIASWKKDRPQFTSLTFSNEKIPFAMKVQDKGLMPRYCSCLLHIENLGETPEWMKRRLEATGWRSINLPIDITNYVAMEVGVPLHSFDADDIRGDIHMRTAKKGEKIVTLDKKTVDLSDGSLILSDSEGVFDLLGIMGGLRSSTKENTRRIYLHSASLDPVSVRRTMIATGHRTDAGTVYEKGVPPITTEWGFYRAVELFLAHVPGATIASRMESQGENGTPPTIKLSLSRLTRALGVSIPIKEASTILTSLGCEVSVIGEDMEVRPPLWRLRDITGAHDLIEEVGRIYGYNAIEATLPSASITPPSRDQRVHRMRDALVAEHFIELSPLSLIGPSLLEKAGFKTDDVITLENPIGEELSIMQPSMIPSLLEHAEQNLLQVAETLRTFAWGQVFDDTQKERKELAMFVTQKYGTHLKNDPFLMVKSSLKNAMHDAGYDFVVQIPKNVPSYAHPGRIAAIIVGSQSVGTIFEVHPSIRKKFGLPQRAAIGVIDLDLLFAQKQSTVITRVLPAFPSVAYDETLEMHMENVVGDLLSTFSKKSPLLESVDIVDLFAKNEVSPYSLTLRFTYRAPDRTLTEQEAKTAHESVLSVVR